MAHNVVCKSAAMAFQIIETVAKSMKPGTQQAALMAVAEWLRENIHDIPGTPEERRALAIEIDTSLRNGMTPEERRKKAAFYLEGITEENPRRRS